MVHRRAFVSGLLASGLCPAPTWADAGHPAFLSAARTPEGRYVLCGLTQAGEIAFQHPLPGRGHAAAAHPDRPEAVAFARRPGTFALVVDCLSGARLQRLDAPEGRHFYGHGCFSLDGALLFTTENDYERGVGMIGVWDARRAYARLGEMPSHGIGPHDIRLMPDGETLVVANGGIETHPETGRTKLNLPTMRATLSYLTLDGALRDQLRLPDEHQRNSIRHLAVSASGTVAFAMQWQGDLTEDLPLLGLHNRDEGTLDLPPAASIRALDGYIGSVAITPDGTSTAVTSPRSGLVQVFKGANLGDAHQLSDVCGVAHTDNGFVVTTGLGLIQPSDGQPIHHALSWDNHLVGL